MELMKNGMDLRGLMWLANGTIHLLVWCSQI